MENSHNAIQKRKGCSSHVWHSVKDSEIPTCCLHSSFIAPTYPSRGNFIKKVQTSRLKIHISSTACQISKGKRHSITELGMRSLKFIGTE